MQLAAAPAKKQNINTVVDSASDLRSSSAWGLGLLQDGHSCNSKCWTCSTLPPTFPPVVSPPTFPPAFFSHLPSYCPSCHFPSIPSSLTF
ncbi:hypothetical protein MAM1_0004c00494 [Mucor ambiguus]|uniref:Uncharacterized protein n=1 Tax=Mucor ambiguus TaxID=91626 RepID=A0A0C9MGG1_9FUNG|nr:hypothetical protein MAM1_0004c00494 [Mucor ambiguus]